MILFICLYIHICQSYLPRDTYINKQKKTGRKSSILATQRQGLLQLFSLGLVGHDQSVKVPAAPGNAGENGWKTKSMQAMHPSKMMVPLLIDFCGTRFWSYIIWYVWIIFLLSIDSSALFGSSSQCHRAWSWTWSALRSSWSSPRNRFSNGATPGGPNESPHQGFTSFISRTVSSSTLQVNQFH